MKFQEDWNAKEWRKYYSSMPDEVWLKREREIAEKSMKNLMRDRGKRDKKGQNKVKGIPTNVGDPNKKHGK